MAISSIVMKVALATDDQLSAMLFDLIGENSCYNFTVETGGGYVGDEDVLRSIMVGDDK